MWQIKSGGSGVVRCTHTECRYEAGQVDVWWWEHVQLLQTGNGSGLNQTVWTGLHHSTSHQTAGAQTGYCCTFTWQTQHTHITAAPSPDKHTQAHTHTHHSSLSVFRCDVGCTLQIGAQAGDEGVQAASQAVVHLRVSGWSWQQQPEHQGEGRLGVGAVQTTGQVDYQRQTVERPGLDPADTQGHSALRHLGAVWGLRPGFRVKVGVGLS